MKRIIIALRRYWKASVLTCIMFGILTAVPWSASRPNHLGSYSLCSFTPISTITMFVMAIAFYWFGKGRRKLLYGSIIILLVIFGFTGYWVYSAKLPMDNIRINMAIDYFWFGYDPTYESNTSRIFINLTFHNIGDQDTPAFRVENYNFYINGKKLKQFTYDIFPFWGSTHLWSFSGSPVTVKAYQTTTLTDIFITISKYTRVEGDNLEALWAALRQKNFTLTMTGILCARTYYGPFTDSFAENSLIVVAHPFTTSFAYSP